MVAIAKKLTNCSALPQCGIKDKAHKGVTQVKLNSSSTAHYSEDKYIKFFNFKTSVII